MKGFSGLCSGIGKTVAGVRNASGIFGKLGAALGGLRHLPSCSVAAVDGPLQLAEVAFRSVHDGQQSGHRVAPVAGTLGYSAEDAALAIGLMANAGIKGSQAGTSLRSIMSRMAKPTKESADAMYMLGVSITDEEGQMYSLMEVLEQLRQGFAGGSACLRTLGSSLRCPG